MPVKQTVKRARPNARKRNPTGTKSRRPSPRRSRAVSAAPKRKAQTKAAPPKAPSTPQKIAAIDPRIQAPGKHHRLPPPSVHGVKHSNQMIAKSRQANFANYRGRG